MRDEFGLDSSDAQIRKEIGLKKSEWIRRLTPVELERLNMFPDNHTEGPTDGKRAFFMGNALVIGIIKRLGDVLALEGEQNGLCIICEGEVGSDQVVSLNSVIFSS